MISKYQGRTEPIDPRISDIPIKRMVGRGIFSNQICPVFTKYSLDLIDLRIPEGKKIAARSICPIQSAISILKF
jgi:hypothetical protein